MGRKNYARVVIGGGIFGTYAALVLANKGHTVLLIEQDSKIMNRASFVNQARLHTGLHYPRSFITASESLDYYKAFRNRFPNSVKDFKQIYAVSKHNSKTSGKDFQDFVSRLGVQFKEIETDQYFNKGMVSHSFEVDEPTFDSTNLRIQLMKELENNILIHIKFKVSVTGGVLGDICLLTLDTGEEIEADGVVLAVYAGTNSLRTSMGLPLLPLNFELAEVNLGTVTPDMRGLGFTVMDGPFWSLMPFGNSELVSLTSVGLTPLRRSSGLPIFDCQDKRTGCSGSKLADCGTCNVRPVSSLKHQIQQMSLFLKNSNFFTHEKSLLTVKSKLSTSQVDDARPTLILKEGSKNIWTVFSGKISTLFDLEEALF
jgi:hypothetical protein